MCLPLVLAQERFTKFPLEPEIPPSVQNFLQGENCNTQVYRGCQGNQVPYNNLSDGVVHPVPVCDKIQVRKTISLPDDTWK